MESGNKNQPNSSKIDGTKIFLIVPSFDAYNRVQLIQLHNIAKLPTLGSLKLFLEVVETFCNEFKMISADDYESKFPLYFDLDDGKESNDREPHTIELLLDVENLQVKNVELYLLNNEAVIADVEDFECLKIILKRSIKYVTDSCRMTRKEYQKKIDSLIKIQSEEMSRYSQQGSPAKFQNKSMMHIMSLSNLNRKPSLEVGRFPSYNRQTTNEDDSSYTSLPTYNTPGMNKRNVESAKLLHNPNTMYKHMTENNMQAQSLEQKYDSNFNEQSTLFDWRFERIGNQPTNFDPRYRTEYQNANTYPHESGSRKVKLDSPGMLSNQGKSTNYIDPLDLNKTVNPEFVESTVVDDNIKNNIGKKKSENTINVNYMTLQLNVNKNNNYKHECHLSEEAYQKNLNYYSSKNASEQSNDVKESNQAQNQQITTVTNKVFSFPSINDKKYESLSLSQIENAMISNIVETSTLAPNLYDTQLAPALDDTQFVPVLNETQFAEPLNNNDESFAIGNLDFVTSLNQTQNSIIGNNNQFNPQLNNVCRFEESTYDNPIKIGDNTTKKQTNPVLNVNTRIEESFDQSLQMFQTNPTLNVNTRIEESFEQSLQMFQTNPALNVNNRIEQSFDQSLQMLDQNSTNQINNNKSSSLGNNINVNKEESIMINTAPGTGLLGNTINVNNDESIMINTSPSVFLNLNKDIFSGNPPRPESQPKSGQKSYETSNVIFQTRNIKNELFIIENKQVSSNKESNNSKNMDAEDTSNGNNMQSAKNSYQGRTETDRDQKIEGSHFPREKNFCEKTYEKRQTLEGLDGDFNAKYGFGKQIFESLIEIPPDTKPIMETQHYEDGNRYEGELIGGLRQGHGIYYFSSGSKYVGEWKNNLFEGHGIMYYYNQNKYDGNWHMGQKHGYGVMTSKGGNEYRGNWQYDQREGFGEEFFTEGLMYKGEFKQNKAHGKGTYWYNDGRRYVGDFNEDRIEGEGIMYYKDGDRYEGGFCNNKREGKGCYYWKNGDKFEGIFVADQIEGSGVYFYISGGKYEGQFKDGRKEGTGVYFGKDGSKYEGEWKAGKFHGPGIMLYPSKGKYEGEWQNDQRHGKGLMHYDDGDIYDGDWNEDTREGYGEMVFAGGLKYKGQFKCDALNGKGVLYDKDGQEIYSGIWKNSRPFPEDDLSCENTTQNQEDRPEKNNYMKNILEEDDEDSFDEQEEYSDDEEEYTEEEYSDDEDNLEDQKNTESEEFTDCRKSGSTKPQSPNDELVRQVKNNIAENQQKIISFKSEAVPINSSQLKKSKSIKKKNSMHERDRDSKKSNKEKNKNTLSDEKMEDSLDPDNMFQKFGENMDRPYK